MQIKEILLRETIDIDDKLLDELKPYFQIAPRGGSLTRDEFHATLAGFAGQLQFSVMPVKLKHVYGTLEIIGNLDSLENMPDKIECLRIWRPGEKFQLTTSTPIVINRLRLAFFQEMLDLSNSGNITATSLQINEAPLLTSLSGIETMKVSSLDIGTVGALEEDLSKYAGMLINFNYTPKKIPLVKLIAYTHQPSSATLTTRSINAIKADYPETAPYFGLGAVAIFPLVKIFRAANEPHRYADIR